MRINIKLDGMSLNRVSSTKFLGVIVDENLMWKNHIDAISRTISRNIGMLTKLKHFVPVNILPDINYGVLIWGNTSKIYLDKIFKLQKWAIRMISNSRYRSHTGPLFSKLIFSMYMIHLSSILAYLCLNITQISFHQFFRCILLNMFKHTITQQEMPKITVLIKQRKCFLIVQLEIKDLFEILWTKLFNITKPPSEYNWFHFGACLVCSYAFLSVCV